MSAMSSVAGVLTSTWLIRPPLSWIASRSFRSDGDEVLQSIDGDDIGALSFSGNGPGLMTLGIATFEGVAEGITTASLGMDDEDENFPALR